MGSVVPLKKSANSAYLELKNLLGNKLQKVENLIQEKLKSEVNLIQKMSDHHLRSGGKRLRPLLTASCFHMLNNNSIGKFSHIGLAAAVEFIHAATLLHDDVVDLSNDAVAKMHIRYMVGGHAPQAEVAGCVRSRKH